MDICPICRKEFSEYIHKERGCICSICLVSYKKLTHPVQGLYICFRNTYSYGGGIVPVIEGRDCNKPVNIFYMNGIRCVALIAPDGTLMYKQKNKVM